MRIFSNEFMKPIRISAEKDRFKGECKLTYHTVLQQIKTPCLQKVNTLLLLISFTLNSTVAFAQVNPFSVPTPTPTLSPAAEVRPEDFDKICKETLASPTPTTQNLNATDFTQQSQKLSYCKTAKAAREAANSTGVLWKVWAGVASVCAGACAVSFLGVGNEYICVAADISAAVADAAMTKQFQGIMMAMGASVGGLMINRTMNSTPDPEPSSKTNSNTNSNETAKDGTKEPGKDVANKGDIKNGSQPDAKKPGYRDYGACLIAGQAAFQSYSSYGTMKSSLATQKEALTKASALASTSTTAVSQNAPVTSSAEKTGSNRIAAGQMSPEGGSNAATPGNTQVATENVCETAQRTWSTGAVYQCATTSDPSLPKNVMSPRFNNDFKKISGTDISEMFTKQNSPGAAIASSMAGSLPIASVNTFASALSAMEKQMVPENLNSVYAGGRRGGSSNSSKNDDGGINDLMANMMGQFMPKPGEGANPAVQTATLSFGNYEKLSAAAQAEDTTTSIFNRITFRYMKIRDRVTPEAY
jgi:hypothetical protein